MQNKPKKPSNNNNNKVQVTRRFNNQNQIS